MAQWRETFRSPRIWKLDARVALFALPPLLPIFRKLTLTIMVFALITIWVVEIRYKMNFASAMRYIRSRIAGRVRKQTSRNLSWIDMDIAELDKNIREKVEEKEIKGNFFARILSSLGFKIQ
ncbi:hypothetical protein WSS15_29280 [Acetobacter pasteurianus]|uniref:Uncharacterized protein n=4 Tax=Acetobacter TaxID=434 RepID=A0A401WXC6_ACEPA|nr:MULTISPECIES: IcmT/TraK family protein [Acetobacter]PHY95375.1 hypothetical protein CSR02_01175 [Acetobacter pomorum]QHM90104.1 IcmT/TraK family protein [Acetobacter pasteurianus]GCD54017.1 hypothetical protein NBRC3188_2714 [Acetobacter pasteurianus NBRC 3188]GCD60417.1 hypothetical protein NBRC3277_2992 [Acetobacter pasteurianus NBRC 3277]GCD63978.1 hypothetical protein NBRC3278_3071 [Acetobacter pasteurianus NBRC 3278]